MKMSVPGYQGCLKITLAFGILVAIALQNVVSLEKHEGKQRYLVPELAIKTNRPIIGQYCLTVCVLKASLYTLPSLNFLITLSF